jgi:hypothetical protein
VFDKRVEQTSMDERAVRFLIAGIRYDDEACVTPQRAYADCMIIRGYVVPRDVDEPAEHAIARLDSHSSRSMLPSAGAC